MEATIIGARNMGRGIGRGLVAGGNKVKKKLKQRGRARLNAEVTYTPDGGDRTRRARRSSWSGSSAGEPAQM